jgi:hypothetical protein
MKILLIIPIVGLFCFCFFAKQSSVIEPLINNHLNCLWLLGPFSWLFYQIKGLVMFSIGFLLVIGLLFLFLKLGNPILKWASLVSAIGVWVLFGWLFYAPLT